MPYFSVCCLVQKRHLFGLASCKDLGGCLSDEVFQRAGHLWHKRAQFEDNAKPLAIARAVTNQCSPGLWSAHRHGDLALKPAHDQLTTAGGNGEERVRTLTVAAPDSFDKRRVGPSILIKDKHFIYTPLLFALYRVPAL